MKKTALFYFKSLPFLFLIIILGGCKMVYYNKINLVQVKPSKYLSRNFDSGLSNYNLIVHTTDTSSEEYFEVNYVLTENEILTGVKYYHNDSKEQREYYDELKSNQKEDHAKTEVKAEDINKHLDQIHIWVSDSVFQNIDDQVEINTNKVLAIEKVQKRIAYGGLIILGAVIGFLLMILTLLLIAINNVYINVYQ